MPGSVLATSGGALAGFGLLKFVPGISTIKKVVGILGILLLVGLALAQVGFGQPLGFIEQYPTIMSVVIGFLGASALVSLF